ncbi:hypothetical protein D3C72_2385000 [compost metagenome]
MRKEEPNTIPGEVWQQELPSPLSHRPAQPFDAETVPFERVHHTAHEEEQGHMEHVYALKQQALIELWRRRLSKVPGHDEQYG